MAAWNAARDGAPYLTTSVIDPTVNFFNSGTVPVSSFRLANNIGVFLAGPADDVYTSGFGAPQYGDGYTGQLADSTTGTDTLTFSAPLTAFALTVVPDDPELPPTTDTLTIALSDGTRRSETASFGFSTVQLLGYTGAPV